MAGWSGYAAEAGQPAPGRRHGGGGGHLDTKAQAREARWAFATCNWHVHWNTTAGPVIPAFAIPVRHSGPDGGEVNPGGEHILRTPCGRKRWPQPWQESR